MGEFFFSTADTPQQIDDIDSISGLSTQKLVRLCGSPSRGAALLGDWAFFREVQRHEAAASQCPISVS
jgi:hypothetical protein